MLRVKLTYRGSSKAIVVVCKKCRKVLHKDGEKTGQLCVKCRK